MSGIDIRHVSKSFRDKLVLSDLSLSIREGSTTCIMGPSGCGKTTLLRIIAGLEQADEGEIRSELKKISFVFQEDRLSENYSAVSNLQFVVGKSVPRKALEDLLGEFGLAESMYRPVHELSGGMKRRVAIARALCAPYELLILDEPLQGLDEALRQSVIDIIKRKTAGKTVLLVTHEKEDADALGEQLILMEKKG